MPFSSRIRITCSVWLVSGRAHVFILLSVVNVTLPNMSTSAVTVSIFVFVVGFGRFYNTNRGSRSVSVFMVVYKQNATRGRLPDADEK